MIICLTDKALHQPSVFIAIGPMTPYTPLNITNIHNIDLIPATPLISSDLC